MGGVDLASSPGPNIVKQQWTIQKVVSDEEEFSFSWYYRIWAKHHVWYHHTSKLDAISGTKHCDCIPVTINNIVMASSYLRQLTWRMFDSYCSW